MGLQCWWRYLGPFLATIGSCVFNSYVFLLSVLHVYGNLIVTFQEMIKTHKFPFKWSNRNLTGELNQVWPDPKVHRRLTPKTATLAINPLKSFRSTAVTRRHVSAVLPSGECLPRGAPEWVVSVTFPSGVWQLVDLRVIFHRKSEAESEAFRSTFTSRRLGGPVIGVLLGKLPKTQPRGAPTYRTQPPHRPTPSNIARRGPVRLGGVGFLVKPGPPRYDGLVFLSAFGTFQVKHVFMVYDVLWRADRFAANECLFTKSRPKLRGPYPRGEGGGFGIKLDIMFVWQINAFLLAPPVESFVIGADSSDTINTWDSFMPLLITIQFV